MRRGRQCCQLLSSPLSSPLALLLLVAVGAMMTGGADGQAVASLDVCPSSARWPVPSSYLVGIQNWTTAQYQSYVQDKVGMRAAPNLAFFGLALLTLLVLLWWRLLRCCFLLCCGLGQAPSDPLLVVEGRGIWVWKGLAIVLAIGVSVTSILGVALADATVVTSVLGNVNAVVDSGGKVVVRISNLNDAILAVTPITVQMTNAAVGLPSSEVAQIDALASALQSSVTSASSTVQSGIKSVNSTVSGAHDVVASTGQTVNDYYAISVKVSQGLCGAAMLISFLVVLFASIHCPFGIAFGVFFCLCFVTLYFILGLAFAVIMILESDVCPNLEPVITQTVTSNLTTILAYYFSASLPSSPPTLETVLANAGLFNVTDLRAQTTGQLNSSTTQLSALISSMPASYQPTFNAIVSELTTAANNVDATIGYTTPTPIGVIGMGAWSSVHALYVGVKGSLCCMALDQLTLLWAIFTSLGWLLLLQAWVAMAVLARLDALPQAGTCCACSCVTAGKLVRPMDDGGDVWYYGGAAGGAGGGGGHFKPFETVYYPPVPNHQGGAPQQMMMAMDYGYPSSHGMQYTPVQQLSNGPHAQSHGY